MALPSDDTGLPGLKVADTSPMEDTGTNDELEDIIKPQDSASQAGSNAYSAIVEHAILEVQVAAMRERQQIELEELHLKQKREQLELKTRLAISNAKEQANGSHLSRSNHSKPPTWNQKEPTPTSSLNPSASPWEPDRQPGSQPTGTDLLKVIVEGQNCQRATLEAIRLPPAEIVEFDGDPLQYWTFTRSFENSIANSSLRDSDKLSRLLKYCKGHARKVIECCTVMSPDLGYKRALELLKERFCNDYMITEAWVKKITNGPKLGARDSEGLRELVDNLAVCVETLTAMGHLEEISTQSVLVSVVERLPNYGQNRWIRRAHEIRKKSGGFPKIADVMGFIKDLAEENADPVYGKLGMSRENTKANPGQNRVSRGFVGLSGVSEGKRCVVCGEGHTLFSCAQFKSKKPEERFAIAKQFRFCFNCLSSGHGSNACKLNRTCSVPGCGRKHTKFLHRSDLTQGNKLKETAQLNRSQTSTSELNRNVTETVQNVYIGMRDETTCNATGAGVVRVALPIVPVKVRAVGSNQAVQSFALLDNCSTSSFCSAKLMKDLGIPSGELKQVTLSLTTLEKSNSVMSSNVVSLLVEGQNSGEGISLPSVYTKAQIPVRPENVATDEDLRRWPHLNGVDLPKVNASDVGLLIGQDAPEALLPLEVKRGSVGAPFAVRTKLGWTVSGPLGYLDRNVATCNFVTNEVLESQLQKFWKLDSDQSLLSDARGMSVNDKRAVSIWEDSLSYKDGHYEMAIPFKVRPPEMSDNYEVAAHRLQGLSKRLNRDRQLLTKYREGMDSLLDKGYAELVPEEELAGMEGSVWYLPHHPVFHPQKPEKLRIVFDCASKHKGVSLNDKVLQGPDLTNRLVGILARFREKPVAIMGDVDAMFHQVRVSPQDKDVLRFLWWPDGDMDQRPAVYRMTVHLFGGTWSPSCCSYALRRTAEDNREDFHSDVVDTVQNDFYVDDCVKSMDTEEEGVKLVGELCTLLSRGGFNIGKWVSNSQRVLQSIPAEDRAKKVSSIDLNYEAMPVERALGLNWDVELDCFGFKTMQKDKPKTKRGLLSLVSSLYDPLGLVSPFTLQAKAIIQDLSRKKVTWDEELPVDNLQKWNKWEEQLPMLETVKVNRCLKPHDFGVVVRRELHHFSDASELAYGAASYLRLVNDKGQVHCSLIMSKSHLAPIKKLTIPRLELLAATLSVKLDVMLRRELQGPVDESVFWSDSTIVLHYIKNEDKRFHTFVANRIPQIRDGSSPSQWHHVESKCNPADDISRGLSVVEMLGKRSWFQGPEFLWLDRSGWPAEPLLTGKVDQEDPEVKAERDQCNTYLTREDRGDATNRLIEHYSSWHQLKKTVVWWLRVKAYLLGKVRGTKLVDLHDTVSVDELCVAEEAIVLYVQKSSFKEEMKILGVSQACDDRHALGKSSPLSKLSPVVNESGLLCVGGRLKNAPISGLSKSQMILPRMHHVVNLIIRHFHLMCGHGGREHVLSLLRERFWIIGARVAVRAVLRSCFVCKRVSAAPVTQRMADLLCDRVTPEKPPFTFVGVDCFGPFSVKQGRSVVKRYGCIFTCLVLRAIHIEILHSMDTDSFINALQRFICRRGTPEIIRSDNGSNFVGAQRELKEALQSWNQGKIHEYLLQREIKWLFNPPTASHMGGAWERQIRSIRKVVNSVCMEQTHSDESLSTLMCLVESCVNSRPITVVSDDVKDSEPLTPNHLLLLRPGNVMPSDKLVKRDLYSRRRWRQVQYLADVFWRRWLKEYLPTLQLRSKWQKLNRNVAEGDVVLIVDDSLPRSRWLLGRVVETHVGRDKLVRSVDIKTKLGVLTRPIQKICMLEEIEKQ